MKLREQRALDTGSRLVTGPELVAKRLDHVIGADTDVGVASLDHLQHALQHADDGTVRPILALVESAQPVEMPKQLVGAVDEMNDHCASIHDFTIRTAFVREIK